MAYLSLSIGIILALVGLGGYVATGMQHLTALIPFVLGDLFITIGVLTLVRPGWRKHLMHAAATLALLGMAGTLRGLVKGIQWLQGVEPERPAAILAQSATAVLCAVFVVLAVRSFINARRAREAAAAR